MNAELRRLRDRLHRNRGRGEHRPRFPRPLRAEVAAFAHRRSREGMSLIRLADALDLGRSTLQLWVKQFPPSEPEPRLRPVEVSDAVEPVASHSRPVLVLPDGCRVENLELGDLLTLLRGLR